MAINTQKIRQKAKKNQGIILIFFLIVVVGGFVAYRQYSVWTDKQKFEKAQASIDTLYADIVVRLGPPNNYEHNQSCGRPNQKFEQGPLSCNVGLPSNYERSQSCGRPNQKYNQGPLSCNVGIGFVYALNEGSDPLELIQSIDNVISLEQSGFKFNDSSLGNELTPPVIIKEYLNKPSGMDCRIKYAYDSPQDIHLELKDNSIGSSPLYVGLSCGSSARTEYYKH